VSCCLGLLATYKGAYSLWAVSNIGADACLVFIILANFSVESSSSQNDSTDSLDGKIKNPHHILDSFPIMFHGLVRKRSSIKSLLCTGFE